MSQTLTLTRPDDWHLHFRDGEQLRGTVPATAAVFRRAIVMPNLTPPVTATAQALAYRERILSALAKTEYVGKFEPLMTLYLTDNTQPEEIVRAKERGFVHGVKLYRREFVISLLDRMREAGQCCEFFLDLAIVKPWTRTPSTWPVQGKISKSRSSPSKCCGKSWSNPCNHYA